MSRSRVPVRNFETMSSKCFIMYSRKSSLSTYSATSRFTLVVRARATSVKREVAEYVDNDDFLEYMMKHFEDIVSKFRTGTRDRLIKDYRGLCTTIGKEVVVSTSEGKVR